MGVLSIKVPEMLENLVNKIEEYGSIHPKAYIANPVYNINESIVEFQNIDTTLNTDQYRRDKIRNLKEWISRQIHQLFSLSEEEK